MRAVLILGFAAASLLRAAAAGSDAAVTREGGYWVQVVEGEAAGNGATRLRVNAEGTVTLRGASGFAVRYVVKKRVQARSQGQALELLRMYRIRTFREGSLLRMYFGSGGAAISSSEVTITAPRGLRDAFVDAVAGSVSASDFDGDARVLTGAGRIDLDDIRGSCIARTGGGDLRVGRIGGGLQCYTGGGTIRVAASGGEVRLETVGGDIFLGEASGRVYASTGAGNVHIGRSRAAVTARTMGGLIDVTDAGGPVVADNSGGAIQIDSAHGAECASSTGAIRLKNVNGAVRAATGAGSILAELLAGHVFENSTLSTSSGDVTVLIPSNIALTVLARNESLSTLGRIVSEFREIHVRPASVGRFTPVIAEGSLNGGGPVLRIRVAAGSIYLRHQQ